jgi:GNAT superfamily N-acetyltransferase
MKDDGGHHVSGSRAHWLPSDSAVITFRDAGPEDADQIVHLLIRTKEESLPALTDDHDRNFAFWHDRWRRYIRDGAGGRVQKALGDSCMVLAERGGRLVGFAAYHHTRRWHCDAELESMYVSPDCQHQGIGTELLRVIIERLRAEGSSSMCVGYNPRNPYKRFYWKHGATEINPHWAAWRSLPEIGGRTPRPESF